MAFVIMNIDAFLERHMKEKGIKTCPFCGNEGDLLYCGMTREPRWSICCDSRGGNGPGQCPTRPVAWGKTKEEAIKAWNKRV
jgi:hypothetical protein